VIAAYGLVFETLLLYGLRLRAQRRALLRLLAKGASRREP
jgi:hypothetical protein